jgi:glycerol-3-phosphate dehydrogenase
LLADIPLSSKKGTRTMTPVSSEAPLDLDLFVVGGGINGAGIARDAAGRGLSVAVCEQNDFAGATSSASTKLIHGGLRYLEYYEFRLVAEALAEREVLLAIAPHIARPLRFVMPHAKGLRPAWMIRLGLFLYDRLGRTQIEYDQAGIVDPGIGIDEALAVFGLEASTARRAGQPDAL